MKAWKGTNYFMTVHQVQREKSVFITAGNLLFNL